MKSNNWRVRAVVIIKKSGRVGLYKRTFVHEFPLSENIDNANAIMKLWEALRTFKELENETIESVIEFTAFNTAREDLL